MMDSRPRPQRSRVVLGVLLAFLLIAVLLALWALLFGGNDSTDLASGQAPSPTPLTIATATPLPAASPTPVPTVTPSATTTPIPEGLQACADDNLPLTTATYVVDTNTTPLNQRTEPSIDANREGAFDAGQKGLVFTGECVVNVVDGYTWWKIFNGTRDVWVASDFVTVN